MLNFEFFYIFIFRLQHFWTRHKRLVLMLNYLYYFNKFAVEFINFECYVCNNKFKNILWINIIILTIFYFKRGNFNEKTQQCSEIAYTLLRLNKFESVLEVVRII